MAYTAALSLCLSAVVHAQTPLRVTPGVGRGPDGPWHTFRFTVGSENQTVDLFASTLASSFILNNATFCSTQGGTFLDACFDSQHDNITDTDYFFYSPANSSTATNATVGSVSAYDGSYTPLELPLQSTGESDGYLDTITVTAHTGDVSAYNATIGSVNSYEFDFPSGKTLTEPIGTIGLGTNQTTEDLGDNNYLLASLLQGGVIPSMSFGLHLGSIRVSVPSSLVLGGFDKSRLLGKALSGSFQPNNSPMVQLTDISIGVVDGFPNPFENSGLNQTFSGQSVSGLLSQGNSSLADGLQTRIAPPTPYIFLPQSVCDAITSYLPVTFNEEFGLYYWDASNPAASSIINSAAYLNFTFQQDSETTISVCVPFLQLNLLLTYPFVAVDVSYLPISPINKNNYALGRGFLQSAFFSANWLAGDLGYFFLGQGPGPDISVQSLVSIDPDQTTMQGIDTPWTDTWMSTFQEATGTTPSSSSSGGGLSTGAKVGIGIGVAVAGLLIIALGVFLFMRYRKKQKAKKNAPSELAGSAGKRHAEKRDPGADSSATSQSSTHRPLHEADPEAVRVEADNSRTILEADPEAQTLPAQELSADASQIPVELPGDRTFKK